MSDHQAAARALLHSPEWDDVQNAMRDLRAATLKVEDMLARVVDAARPRMSDAEQRAVPAHFLGELALKAGQKAQDDDVPF